MATIIVLLLCGCDSEQQLKVLVIHQFDENQTTYTEFDETIVATFKKRGYNPNIRNFYLNLEDQAFPNAQPILQHIKDSLLRDEWKADVILGEGDRALRAWSSPDNPNILKGQKPVISVFGGIVFGHLNTLNHSEEINLIHDKIDIRRNIAIIQNLTGQQDIDIELDSYHDDSLLYAIINQQIGLYPYAFVADSNGYVNGSMPPSIQTIDSMTIHFHSVEWAIPTNNSSMVESEKRQFFQNTTNRFNARNASLVVKKDIWSETIANATNTPQFTICREFFGDGRGRYLCGYFSSYGTIASDIVEFAIDRLQGKTPTHVNRIHTPNYYMDYKAMEKLNMEYSDYKENFIIKNAPYQVSHPLHFSILIFSSFAFISLIIFLINFFYLKNRRNSIRGLANMLEEEKKLSQLAIDASGNFYIGKLKDLQRILDSMGPDQDKCKEEIKKSLNELGTHRHNYRILAAMDEEKNMTWWNLHYQVNHNTIEELNIEGYLLNVNEDVQFEREMEQIKHIASETKRTEGFLWTMAHEIRTPLNAIVGFCDVLKVMGADMSKKEKDTITQGIETNNRLLEHIVDNLDDYSNVSSNQVSFKKENVMVGDVIREMYEENRLRFIKKGLLFKRVDGREDFQIVADKEMLKRALFQLLDNALKFTQKGSVAIGWQLNLNHQNVELFVEDSGMGISPDDLSLIFDIFWKKDTFMAGVGIGLSLVSEYTKAMGGKIEVQSQMGIGSRFHLAFNIKPPKTSAN